MSHSYYLDVVREFSMRHFSKIFLLLFLATFLSCTKSISHKPGEDGEFVMGRQGKTFIRTLNETSLQIIYILENPASAHRYLKELNAPLQLLGTVDIQLIRYSTDKSSITISGEEAAVYLLVPQTLTQIDSNPSEVMTAVQHPENLFQTVFVTTTTRKGDSAINDSICSAEAAASPLTSGLGGTWRVLMSDHFGVSAFSRITFRSGAALKTPNGDLIVPSASQLWSSALLHPINVTASGSVLMTPFPVWTGTYADGSPSLYDSEDCAGWSDNKYSEFGISGNALATDGTWVNSGTSHCNNNHGFYCINSKE